MTRQRRASGFYPTDPRAVGGLRWWIARLYPAALTQSWIDPCAGYGGLIEALGVSRRGAIEIDSRHAPELLRRVPSAVIGDGLIASWDGHQHVVMNPDFANATMTAFVARAMAHQEESGGLVCCLALATWWHSNALRLRGAGLRRPDHVLVPDRRVSCDGTGRGDERPIDWLVWTPDGGDLTNVHWLPPIEPDLALVTEHRRLASQGA